MPHKESAQSVTRREHEYSREARRVIQTDPFGGLATVGNFSILMDGVDTNELYIGRAQLGTGTDGEGWQIRKIVRNGDELSILWAESTDDFIHTWDDRTSYTYL